MSDSDHGEDDILLQYEEMFRHRFTDEDTAYTETFQRPAALPPCVENWYTRPKRTYDWTRSQQDQRGNYSDRRSYNDDRNRGSRDRPWRGYDNRRGGGGYEARDYGGHGGGGPPYHSDHYGGGRGYCGRGPPSDGAQRGGSRGVYYAGMRQDSSGERPPKYSRGDDGQRRH